MIGVHWGAATSRWLLADQQGDALERRVSPREQAPIVALEDREVQSGKITAVEPHTFVIKIEQVKPPGEESSQEDHISSMTFRIDSKTRMEGKLEVGASADIVYRQRNTQYVAVTVHVTPTSS